MGRQGYLIVAIIVVVTGFFAASRSDWTSMLVSALVLPLIMFLIICAVSQRWRGGATLHPRRGGLTGGMDLITFLARTNPVMFLIFGGLGRRLDDDRYQQLVGSGPYGMGRQGYLLALTLLLAPLTLALVVTAVTGHQLAHSGPGFP
jgi:protein-S-isoprenylcysteine O-methyltransferase Ste14